MIKKLLKNKFAHQTIWALGGQVSFLMANFLLFIILVNQVPKEVYGIWAIYITFISIADSVRQGMVQNGLSRLMVAYPTNLSLKSTGTLLNFTIILYSVCSQVFFQAYLQKINPSLKYSGTLGKDYLYQVYSYLSPPSVSQNKSSKPTLSLT